jgi:hypothetical protein
MSYRTPEGITFFDPRTISEALADECVCDHCREVGTCLGCTSGVCP